MKVKVNLMNTRCILVTEAVTVSKLIAMASLVSEIWWATDGQTHRQTDSVIYPMITFSYSAISTLKKPHQKQPRPHLITILNLDLNWNNRLYLAQVYEVSVPLVTVDCYKTKCNYALLFTSHVPCLVVFGRVLWY